MDFLSFTFFSLFYHVSFQRYLRLGRDVVIKPHKIGSFGPQVSDMWQHLVKFRSVTSVCTVTTLVSTKMRYLHLWVNRIELSPAVCRPKLTKFGRMQLTFVVYLSAFCLSINRSFPGILGLKSQYRRKFNQPKIGSLGPAF